MIRGEFNFDDKYVEKSVQLVRASSFRNDLLQNPYFKSPGPKIGSTIYPEEILEVTVKGNRKIFAPRSSIKIENADNQEMTNEIIDQESIKNHDSTLSLNLNAKSGTSHEFYGEEYDDLYENNETDVEEMNGFEQGNLL